MPESRHVEIEDYIAKRQQDMAATGDESIQFELTSLNQALMMMEQRTQDLRTAENVAMQSIPMIKTMEFSNYNLVRKINSAFIVTLPVFKQALAQAILLKRQRIQAEAMSALDKKTNEMLIKNAQNTVEVSSIPLVIVLQVVSSVSIWIELPDAILAVALETSTVFCAFLISISLVFLSRLKHLRRPGERLPVVLKKRKEFRKTAERNVWKIRQDLRRSRRISTDSIICRRQTSKLFLITIDSFILRRVILCQLIYQKDRK